MKKIKWELCLVADVEAAGKKSFLSCIQEAVEGGVTMVQLRAKKLNSKEFLDLALDVSNYLRANNIPLIINDRVDIAFSSQSQGVHLGQEDLPLPYARKILGKERIIGISVNTPEEVLKAESQGADYLGVGPIFSTSSKKTLKPILGVSGLRSIRKKTNLPLLAIGGINSQNIKEVIASGAEGAAVISAIMSASNIKLATKQLRQAIKEVKNKKLGSGLI